MRNCIKKIFTSFLTLTLSFTIFMATNVFGTESTNDKQQYVAIINENGSKKVHVYNFTLKEAEEFKNKTDSIIAFALV